MTEKKAPLPQPEGGPVAGAQPGAEQAGTKPAPRPALPKEIGGAPGPEPTRYGDWQHKGRVSDF
jgi:homeobox protein ESX1